MSSNRGSLAVFCVCVGVYVRATPGYKRCMYMQRHGGGERRMEEEEGGWGRRRRPTTLPRGHEREEVAVGTHLVG